MRRRVPPKSLGGREEVSLSPHVVTALRSATFGFQACVDRSGQLVHHLLGLSFLAAPDSLIHGLCTVSYTHLDVYKRQAYMVGNNQKGRRYSALKTRLRGDSLPEMTENMPQME